MLSGCCLDDEVMDGESQRAFQQLVKDAEDERKAFLERCLPSLHLQ